VLAALTPFIGRVLQVPPAFSAILVDGERAYDLARDGVEVELKARETDIYRLEIVETPDGDHTRFDMVCGKGTYVRAFARDIGRALGCFGHVTALTRNRRFLWKSWRNLLKTAPPSAVSCRLRRRWTTSRRWP
jgi:tRNA pseudouridine55 synthase